MAPTGECDPIAPLIDHWQTRQSAILRDCLDQLPELIDLAPNISGLRVGLGAGLPSGPDNWDLLSLIGQDGDTLGVIEGSNRNNTLIAMTSDGSTLEIKERDVVLLAQRHLMSLCIQSLRELAALSATHLKTAVHHPALRDLLNQQLLAIRCQAEITEIAVNDPQADGFDLLSAIADAVQSYLQWAAQVDGLNTDWIMFAKEIGRHVGTPWLLAHSATPNHR